MRNCQSPLFRLLLVKPFVELPNAAPEWQAGSSGWQSRENTVACQLEGPGSHFLRFVMQCSPYHFGDLVIGINVLNDDTRMRESKDTEYLIGKCLAN